MVSLRIGVVNVDPVCKRFPLLAASNHSYVPPGAVAMSVDVFPSQMVVLLTVGDAGKGCTVTVTAVKGLLHPLTVTPAK